MDLGILASQITLTQLVAPFIGLSITQTTNGKKITVSFSVSNNYSNQPISIFDIQTQARSTGEYTTNFITIGTANSDETFTHSYDVNPGREITIRAKNVMDSGSIEDSPEDTRTLTTNTIRVNQPDAAFLEAEASKDSIKINSNNQNSIGFNMRTEAAIRLKGTATAHWGWETTIAKTTTHVSNSSSTFPLALQLGKEYSVVAINRALDHGFVDSYATSVGDFTTRLPYTPIVSTSSRTIDSVSFSVTNTDEYQSKVFWEIATESSGGTVQNSTTNGVTVGSGNSTTATATGLNPGQEYFLRAVYQEIHSADSGYADVISYKTIQEAPQPNIYSENIEETTDSVEFNVSNEIPANETWETMTTQVKLSTQAWVESQSFNATTRTAQPIKFTGLSPNTSYTINARNIGDAYTASATHSRVKTTGKLTTTKPNTYKGQTSYDTVNFEIQNTDAETSTINWEIATASSGGVLKASGSSSVISLGYLSVSATSLDPDTTYYLRNVTAQASDKLISPKGDIVSDTTNSLIVIPSSSITSAMSGTTFSGTIYNNNTTNASVWTERQLHNITDNIWGSTSTAINSTTNNTSASFSYSGLTPGKEYRVRTRNRTNTGGYSDANNVYSATRRVPTKLEKPSISSSVSQWVHSNGKQIVLSFSIANNYVNQPSYLSESLLTYSRLQGITAYGLRGSSTTDSTYTRNEVVNPGVTVTKQAINETSSSDFTQSDADERTVTANNITVNRPSFVGGMSSGTTSISGTAKNDNSIGFYMRTDVIMSPNHANTTAINATTSDVQSNFYLGGLTPGTSYSVYLQNIALDSGFNNSTYRSSSINTNPVNIGLTGWTSGSTATWRMDNPNGATAYVYYEIMRTNTDYSLTMVASGNTTVEGIRDISHTNQTSGSRYFTIYTWATILNQQQSMLSHEMLVSADEEETTT